MRFGITLLLAFILTLFTSTASANASEVDERSATQSVLSIRVIYGYSHDTMQGWETSTYRGKYFIPTQEGYRKCVQFRESRHRYGAANKTSSARGAYQFLDSQWREPLAHMVYPELRKIHGESVAKDIKKTLFANPINKWSREIQDMAFYTVLNYNGMWSGKKHWYSYNKSC